MRGSSPRTTEVGESSGHGYVGPIMTIETPNATDTEALALARRSGWPEDLRVLIARFPREQWQGHANLGEMARFWLSRHDMFRELATMIQAIEAQFRDCLLYTSDAADDLLCVDLGGRRIIKK